MASTPIVDFRPVPTRAFMIRPIAPPVVATRVPAVGHTAFAATSWLGATVCGSAAESPARMNRFADRTASAPT